MRYRELNDDPAACSPKRGIHAQLVTSAVRRDPDASGATCRACQIVVSIDGLQPEHDVRRTPATYDRILKHIAGHQITVHCTVTRQQVQPRRLPRGVPRSSGRRNRKSRRSGSASTRRRSARCRTSGCGRPIASASSPTCWRCALRYPEAGAAEGPDRRLRQAARVARRVRLRAARRRRSRPTSTTQITPCQFGGNARLQQLRLHRVGRPRRGRAAPAARASSRSARSSTGSLKVGRAACERAAAGRAAAGLML